MYICLCRGITENDIKEACKGPKKTPKEVLKTLGVGSDCGTCMHFAIEKFLEHEAKAPQAAQNRK